jgi:uncharacterized repeat protein (TIGR03803 family)
MTKSIFTLAILLAFLTLQASVSRAQTYSILYSFTGVPGPDGENPSGPLTRDAAGNLYGTTQGGGQNSLGTIFKLAPDGTENVLYSFSLHPDAMLPGFGLSLDATGDLFGVSGQGGLYGPKNGDGTIFKLDTNGNESVLHSFGKGKDGNYPGCVLVSDSKGNLYGTTEGGGTYGAGTVFKLTPAGKEVKLHNFTGLDGEVPVPSLVLDAKGNLFGATIDGGAYGEGTVFKLTRAGKYTILYSFCQLQNCADGRTPESGVVQDSSGNLFGTTAQGGTYGQGTVYEITNNGQEVVLHNFGNPGSNDGRWPFAGLVLDSVGNLYGTTYIGGTNDAGSIFKVDATGNETVLHSFCAQPNCTDGSAPWYSLIRDPAGNLYGVAEQGPNQRGLVFELTP